MSHEFKKGQNLKLYATEINNRKYFVTGQNTLEVQKLLKNHTQQNVKKERINLVPLLSGYKFFKIMDKQLNVSLVMWKDKESLKEILGLKHVVEIKNKGEGKIILTTKILKTQRLKNNVKSI